MTFRMLALSVVALLAVTPAMAQDYNFTRDIVGAKTDETTRNNAYINDATSAGDRATERAMKDKVPVKHVQPQHEVIMRESNGVMVPRDVYIIPASPEESAPY
jgi:hypothetical protein